LKGILSHEYLKFTSEHSESSINFLDVNVKLYNQNKLATSLFSKPMNKHVYLHSQSDHPVHLKNSLFFSQGLRIVRICSELPCRLKLLHVLYSKFKQRGYNDKILYPSLIKLCTFSRLEALRPKKPLLRNYLSIHNPELMEMHNVTTLSSRQSSSNVIYVVFPFYKCVPSYAQEIMFWVRRNASLHCTSEAFKQIIDELTVRVVFSRTHNVKEEIQKRR